MRQEKKDWQREKEQLSQQIQDQHSEKSRLMQEINSLQLKNAQLVEDHTRDVLAIKSKETQLIRAHSDIESARLQISQLELDAEQSRNRPLQVNTSGQRGSIYSRLASPTSPSASSLSYESPVRGQGHYQRSSNSPLGSPSSMRRGGEEFESREEEHDETSTYRRQASRPLSYQESKPGPASTPSRFGSVRNSYYANASETSSGIPSYGYRRTFGGGSSGSGHSGADGEGTTSWKKAADVTEQLKARIEAMKLRQKMNGQPSSSSSSSAQ